MDHWKHGQEPSPENVQLFFGHPSVNLVDGDIAQDDAQWTVTVTGREKVDGICRGSNCHIWAIVLGRRRNTSVFEG